MRRIILPFLLVLYFFSNSGCKQFKSLSLRVTGLASGESVTLSLSREFATNVISELTFTSDTTQVFDNKVSNEDLYLIAITSQPTSQTCTVQHPYDSGLYSDRTVDVVCSSTTHTVGGTVSGLLSGRSFELALNRTSLITVSEDGSFTFPQAIAEGGNYEITFSELPTDERCIISSTSGTASADINLTITCSRANLFFTKGSANNFRGDLGGRSGANQTCQDFVDSLDDVSCDHVVAFLSLNADDEIRDFPTQYDFDTSLPIYFSSSSPTGEETIKDHAFIVKIADNWDDLLDGSIDHFLYTSDIWSGSNSDGSVAEGKTCDEWTTNEQTKRGNLTVKTEDDRWMSYTSYCNTYGHLGCLCLQGSENGGTTAGSTGGSGTAGSTSAGSTGGETSGGSSGGTSTAGTSTSGTTGGSSTGGSTGGSGGAPATEMYFFPTNTAIAANFGGRSSADALCETTRASTYSSLDCTTARAFLSYSSSDEIQDFPSLYGVPTTLPLLDASNSNTKIADTWTDLLDGTIDSGFTVNWWSGTFVDSTSAGVSAEPFDCGHWTSTSHMDDAVVGRSGQTGAFWSGFSDGLCDESYRLMCLCYR